MIVKITHFTIKKNSYSLTFIDLYYIQKEIFLEKSDSLAPPLYNFFKSQEWFHCDFSSGESGVDNEVIDAQLIPAHEQKDLDKKSLELRGGSFSYPTLES